ncbi:glycosyltransferase [Neobacillus drentensis]|uniref:glycosyltransferase n=1 Tax=Neobacillus drentensis TaxID=220684 RepID=UPI003000EA02
MKQLLWIGCLESDEEFKIKAKKGYDLASAQVSQQNILNGIERVNGGIFDSINGSVLPPYPVYEDRIVQEVVWSHADGAYDVSVGYKNDKYINRVNCKNAMKRAAKTWIKDRYQNGELHVLVYSMRSAPMATACYIKKRIPSAKIYLIVTDLPQFMDLGQSKLKAFLKKFDWMSIKKMQRQFDGFILYASKMAEILSIPDDKWLLMEGSYDNNEIIDVHIEDSRKQKAIMYSGKLDEQYGIRMLLDAFMSIEDSNIELWLTGGGNAEGYIKECVKKDFRIKFYGFLPSREDVLKFQKQSALLVNMRLPSEPASDYCFPSKMFEYMATGIPVLTFKLGGIPQDYSEFIYFIDEETQEALSQALTGILYKPGNELIDKGISARKFILDNKTTYNQCQKIINFIKR